MRVSLLSPYSGISNMGIRTISSVLKKAGINTQLIFLPIQGYYNTKERFGKYSQPVIDGLSELLNDTDIIGISLVSNFFPAIKDLTMKLRERVGKPIVWGGVHPTVCPEQCIEVADYICIGEGEISFLELCRRLEAGMPTDSIPGIYSGKRTSVQKYEASCTVMGLDSLPFQDYDLEENYLLRKNKLIKITEKNIQRFIGVTFDTYFSRGCPFQCAYCVNNALRRLSRDLTTIRVRSPRHTVDEIKYIRKKLPFIKYIFFHDDTFVGLPERKIAELCELYKNEVGLPFGVSGFEPTVFSEKKLDYLVDAGLIRSRMGIQSGSRRTLKLYKRERQTNDMVKEVASALQKYSDRLTFPSYDILLDNPWESEEDLRDTIDLLSELKPPFSISAYSLTFFPGTDLYERAIKEGLISPNGELDNRHFLILKPSYLNLIIVLFGLFKVPKPLLRFLLKKERIRPGKVLDILIKLITRFILYRKGLLSISKRDYIFIPLPVQRLLCKLFPPRITISHD